MPRQVRQLVSEAVQFGVPIGVHLHNTRNTGFVNAYTALESGASVLEASVGGVGGCPFAAARLETSLQRILSTC